MYLKHWTSDTHTWPHQPLHSYSNPLSILLPQIPGWLYPLPVWLLYDSGEESAYQYGRHRRCKFNPWIGKFPWKRKREPTPAFLPEESHESMHVHNVPLGYGGGGASIRPMTSLVLTRWFLMISDWFNPPFLGETKTVIESQFDDMGLSVSDSICGLLSCF